MGPGRGGAGRGRGLRLGTLPDLTICSAWCSWCQAFWVMMICTFISKAFLPNLELLPLFGFGHSNKEVTNIDPF